VELYPAEGDDDEKRADAKRKIFTRTLARATRHNLIGSVELGGLDRTSELRLVPPQGVNRHKVERPLPALLSRPAPHPMQTFNFSTLDVRCASRLP
jgi:hypothetical protein